MPASTSQRTYEAHPEDSQRHSGDAGTALASTVSEDRDRLERQRMAGARPAQAALMPFATEEAAEEERDAEEEEIEEEDESRPEYMRHLQAGLGNGYLAAAAPTMPIEREAAIDRALQTRRAAEVSNEPEYAQSVRLARPERSEGPFIAESSEGKSEAARLQDEAAVGEQNALTTAEEGEKQLEAAKAGMETGEQPEEAADVLGELEQEEEAAADEEGEKEEGATTEVEVAVTAVPPGVAASQAAVTQLSAAASGLMEATQRPAVFSPHPEESSPTREVADRGAQKRRASEALADAFIARNAHHTEALLTLAYSAPPRIFAAAQAAKASVDAAVAQNVGAITNAIAAALASAQEQAATAKTAIEAQRAVTLVTITAATIAARIEVEMLFTQTNATLIALETSQKTGISAAYTTWHPKLKAVGGEIGAEGMAIAHAMGSAWLGMRNGESSLLDGPIHDNRLEAKADAAKEVAKAYQTEFEKAAGEQAAQVIAGESEVQQYVSDSATQARDGLTRHRDTIVEALNTSHESSRGQANHLADQMLQSIDSSLATITASLREQQFIQVARLDEYGLLQKIAIDDQAGQAVAALLQGGAEAVDGFSKSIREFLETAVGMDAPDGEQLAPALAEAQAQVYGLAATMLGQMAQGIAASEQGVNTGGTQTVDAVNRLGQSSVKQAEAAAAEYVGRVASMLQQTIKGFSQLRDGQNQTALAVKTSAKDGFAGAENGLRDAFSALSKNTDENLSKARDEMRSGLRQSLRQPKKLEEVIEDEAQKAADAVQPRWKSVLKWVITIVVIVAVVALTIVSAGSLGVVGTILLGAALGAAAGAATTIGHNLVDGKKWTDGVGKAMIVGAIGGAFGGIGGAIAGKVASVGLKFAIETGVDVIGGVVGDLAVGNPITAEGVVFGAAIGAGVGAGVGIAGALKGKIKLRPKPPVAAPKAKIGAAPAGPPAPKSRARSFLERTTILAKTPEVPRTPPVPKPSPERPSLPKAAGEAPAPKPSLPLKAAPEAPVPKSKAAPEPPSPKAGPEAAAPKPEVAPEPVVPKEVAEPSVPPPKAAEPSTKLVTDEPKVAARRKTSDGHEITVTKDGRIVRCTNCNLDPYKSVLDADEVLARRADNVKKRLTSDDPDVQVGAAKEWDELSEELERRLKASSPKGKFSEADVRAMSDADLADAITKNPKGTADGEALRYERYVRGKQAKGEPYLGQSEWTKVSRGGRRGGPEHEAIQNKLEAQGFDTEVQFGDRFADAASSTEIHQIGGRNVRGDPIARERDAILDILKSPQYKGQKIYFHDKDTGAKILVADKGEIVLKEWGAR
jgi:hypothetical protein